MKAERGFTMSGMKFLIIGGQSCLCTNSPLWHLDLGLKTSLLSLRKENNFAFMGSSSILLELCFVFFLSGQSLCFLLSQSLSKCSFIPAQPHIIINAHNLQEISFNFLHSHTLSQSLRWTSCSYFTFLRRAGFQ